jgi:hypothetical protein
MQQKTGTAGHTATFNPEDLEVDKVLFDVVIAYNGHSHYCPTVIASQGTVCQFYCNEARDLCLFSKNWVNQALHMCESEEFKNDMSKVQTSLEIAAKVLGPWTDWAKCAAAMGEGPPTVTGTGDIPEVTHALDLGGREGSSQTVTATATGGDSSAVLLVPEPLQLPADIEPPAKKKRKLLYPCSFESCHASFDRKGRLTEHENVVHHGQYFICQFENCDHEGGFNSTYALNRHIKQKHTKEQQYVCEIQMDDGTDCNWVTDERAQFQSHQFHKHQFGGVACPTCGKKFGNKKNMNRHANYCREDTAAEAPVKKWFCLLCKNKEGEPKIFNRQEGYLQHCTAYHVETPKFLCDTCAKPFSSAYNLKMHKAQMHPELVDA